MHEEEKKKLLQLRLFELQVKLRTAAEELLKAEQETFCAIGMDKAYEHIYYNFRYAPIKPVEDVLKMLLIKTK
jgi:hypothetical protein